MKPKADNTGDRRRRRREAVFEEDRVSLAFKLNEVAYRAEILNLTSGGAYLQLPANFEPSDLGPGSKIQACEIFAYQAKLGKFPIGIICHVERDHRPVRVGVCFFSHESETGPQDRTTMRLSSNKAFSPAGFFTSQTKLNERVHFRVADLSKTGAKLTVSARNRLLFRDQKIVDAQLFLPTVGVVEVEFLIRWVAQPDADNQVEIGVEICGSQPKFQELISRYLLTFGGDEGARTPVMLKAGGLKTKHAKTAVSFEILQTEDDYAQVLKLRHDAYKRAHKVSEDSTPNDMADIYDGHSRIIIGKYLGRVVGSVRYTYCHDESQTFELEESIEIPRKFERKSTMEASRACVAEDFEGTDLIHGIFELGSQMVVKLGVKWIITSCEPQLLPLYQKLGFKSQGITFHLKTLKAKPHLLIAVSTLVIGTSRGLNPLIWHYSFGNVARMLRSQGFLQGKTLSLYREAVRRVGVALIGRLKQRHRNR